ncbi:MAG: hypothetical protein R8G66_16915 [Cytophagales bacterium]|nr:hypothetical protein [Cytophagales bacterium]
MEKENKIHSVFVGIALVFWNPGTFMYLYSDTFLMTNKFLILFHSLILFTGLFFIWYLRKTNVKKRFGNNLFSFTFLAILLGLVVVFGSFTRKYKKDSTEGLIFPKNTTIRFKSVEYDYEVSTNSLGLRDREITIDKKDQFRILCFGDSWTEGFGVEVENSWPKKLEVLLNDSLSRKIEVVNCGQKGRYTTDYLKYMKQVVPLLKPDLVLVGVLQLDDLAQMSQNNYSPYANDEPTVSETVIYAFKNYGLELIKGLIDEESPENIDIVEFRKNAVKERLEEMSPLTRKQYHFLSDTVRQLYETGNLNPSMLIYAVELSYRHMVYNNPNHPLTLEATRNFSKDLQSMKALCTKYYSDFVMLNLPTPEFTGHLTERTPNDVLSKYFLENNHVDSIYRSVAAQHEISYMELTDHFLALEEKNKYFYRFDGHPTASGYHEIAQFIGLQLLDSEIIQ